MAFASFATAQRVYVVNMDDTNAFYPSTLEVEPGSIIVWQNNGFNFHTVESDLFGFELDSDFVYPNGYGRGFYYWWRIPFFATSGASIYYHCRYHGRPGNGADFGRGMVGRIVVL
jgi:plastocyanin